MKAVIMAGGEGSRLRPLTSLRPKPMVPIFNQPVMEHIVGLVKHHGIDDIVATLAFMPQVIEDYFGDGSEWGANITYALEETPLGTAGSVKNAEDALRDDTFVVISGDALTDIDLSAVIRFHKERGGLVTLALKSVPDPLEYGVVITAEDGRVERFLEKPSWGQVFSDTINTGIYVVEPEVLDLIPAKTSFDFSSEVFPKIMKKGGAIYGCVVDGYWCDIGSLATYSQAHRDVLDGAGMIFIPGIHAKGDLWVGEGAEVDPEAILGKKVVIGANAKVRAGAHLGDYTVLGDNVVIGHEARVSHSIVWDDTFVGAGSTVRGAVLCRKVDVRRRSTIEQGAAIGDESYLGHDAVIGNDVQIYPYKRIEPAAVVRDSLIWESRAQSSLFGAQGISGLVGVDVTPELALKVAQAFGTTLPAGSHVVVSRDNSRAARMLKRAVVAGLNSTGIHCRDLRVASPSVARFTTRDTRCTGGVHVCASTQDVQAVDLQFFDKDGLDLSPTAEKKVERLYFRGEFRRAFLDEVGEIIYPPRALEYYGTGIRDALEALGTRDRWMRVVADMGGGVASLILPQVAVGWRLNLVAMNPIPDAERTFVTSAEKHASLESMQRDVDVFQANFGAMFDASGERLTLITPSGRVLDGDTALHAMACLWCRTDARGLAVAVPATASMAIERICANAGRTVLRTGLSPRALAEAVRGDGVGFGGSRDGGYLFGDFLATYDSVMALGALAMMLEAADMTLDEIVAQLPEFFLREEQVFCPIDRKGTVMRVVTESVVGEEARLENGVRVALDGGWALVLPDAVEPVVHVFAEGGDAASAEEYLRRYADIVAKAVE